MIVTSNQIVSIHTYSGIQIYQFLPSSTISLTWTRVLKDTSQCDISAPRRLDEELIYDITPWLHWLSVWDGDTDDLLWTGPIQKATANTRTISITARDVSIFAGRTRIPITKRWDAVDPCVIASALWSSMIENHNLAITPIVRADPLGDPFDHSVTADSALVDSVINDLVGLGFKWTVCAGIPILGPMPYTPFTSLSESDFLGDDMGITRDGSNTFNDVLLRGADTISQARLNMGGLNLQTIVNVDSMFGVSNANAAVIQYTKHVAGIRTDISLPTGAVLHPHAPVSVEQLVPGARMVAEIHGLRVLAQLTEMQIDSSGTSTTAKITLESVDDNPPELSKQKSDKSLTTSGATQNAR